MKYPIKSLSLLAAVSLLGACAHHPETSRGRATVKVERDPAAKDRQFRKFSELVERQPMPYFGQRSVDDVLYSFAPYAVGQLKPYFRKAGVSYPPREAALIGLKEEKKLEVWARGEKGKFKFIRDYDIMAASGTKGPKLRQGDKQVPEGVYRIVRLNPNSNYHLSMKLNYPNEFDLEHAELDGRSKPGNDIFIHGKSVSAGCLAMGDAAIEELFVLAAHTGADNISVVIAPHDPRKRPLDSSDPDLPYWTSELYDRITGEIKLLAGHPEPVKVSANRTEQAPEHRLR
jgi:hypothetical protein